MFKTIMVPVDLTHADKLKRALDVAADLSKHYGASAHLVGVTAPQPSAVAHNPTEFAAKLESFVAKEGKARSADFKAKSVTSHDPTIDLDDTLRTASHELGADLVIMASHVPGFAEHVLGSNAGYLASHSDISVMVVR